MIAISITNLWALLLTHFPLKGQGEAEAQGGQGTCINFEQELTLGCASELTGSASSSHSSSWAPSPLCAINRR